VDIVAVFLGAIFSVTAGVTDAVAGTALLYSTTSAFHSIPSINLREVCAVAGEGILKANSNNTAIGNKFFILKYWFYVLQKVYLFPEKTVAGFFFCKKLKMVYPIVWRKTKV
jgi:hypothetical protein